MKAFARIETRLAQFASQQAAVLTWNRERYGQPNFLHFEERRIDWQRAGIKLAIIIQPDFLLSGVEAATWNFRLVAWQDRGRQKCTAGRELVTSMPFRHLEEQIENLLAAARTYLNSIRASDLKCWDDLR